MSQPRIRPQRGQEGLLEQIVGVTSPGGRDQEPIDDFPVLLQKGLEGADPRPFDPPASAPRSAHRR